MITSTMRGYNNIHQETIYNYFCIVNNIIVANNFNCKTNFFMDISIK